MLKMNKMVCFTHHRFCCCNSSCLLLCDFVDCRIRQEAEGGFASNQRYQQQQQHD
jgi:hypothetical protein